MAIIVSISGQSLRLSADRAHYTYPVSTGKAGVGQKEGSYQTPLGQHVIAEKIGDALPQCAVFSARVYTGEICTPTLFAQNPGRDWILTRILRLRGLEAGKNLGPGVDSYDRYIYLHGTPEEEQIGTANSHGCIRMRNADIVELYDLVSVGTLVNVIE